MLKTRICYGAWMLGTVMLYVYSDSYWAFFLLAGSAAILPVCAAAILAVRRKLSYSFQSASMAGKGQQAQGELCIRNNSMIPVMKVCCCLQFFNQLTGERQYQEIYCAVPAKKTEKLNWNLKSKYCGNVQVTIEKVVIYDWMGIFRCRENPDHHGHIVILPDIFPANIQISDSLCANWDSITYSDSKRGDDPSEIFGLREYQPGDSQKNIHWKVSGKLDGLYVKELSLPVENSILLLYETASFGNRKETAAVRDAMMEAFLSVSQSLIQEGHLHALGWYDQEKGIFRRQDVTSVDELAEMTAGFLGIQNKEQGETSIHYYLEDCIDNPYAHVVYITASDGGEDLKCLSEICSASVLQCRINKQEVSGSGEHAMVVFTPETMTEELCQLVI